MSTAPTHAGSAHGEISNGYTWNEYEKQWVNVTHLVTPDKLVIEKEVNSALAEVGVTDEVIDKLFEKAATVDQHIEDGDFAAFEQAERVRKDIQKVRRIGESNMELIHGRYVALWKASGEVKKRTLARLLEPEEIVLKHINSYKRREEERREEEQKRERMLMEQRNNDCVDLKFSVVNGMWVLGSLSVPVDQVMAIDPEGWKNLYTSMRMHSEEFFRLEEEKAKAQAELEEKARKAQELIDKANSLLERSREGELASIGALEAEYPARPLHQYDDATFDALKNTALGKVQKRKEQEESDRKLARARDRRQTLLGCGWVVKHNEHSDGWMEIKANEVLLRTIMFEGGNGLMDISDEEFSELVTLGQNEMLRRREVEDARLAHETRLKVEQERQEREQAEKEAQARAILEQGDKEVLRQMNAAIANAGRHVRELMPNLKAEANIATAERVLKLLVQCHEATK